jgi:hypothetical protein
MFSVVYGSQTEQQYSSLGRTRDWYALSFTDFELIWRLRLMNERDLFALALYIDLLKHKQIA